MIPIDLGPLLCGCVLLRRWRDANLLLSSASGREKSRHRSIWFPRAIVLAGILYRHCEGIGA